MACPNLGSIVADAWEFAVAMGTGRPMQRKSYRGTEYVWMWDWRTGRTRWREL